MAHRPIVRRPRVARAALLALPLAATLAMSAARAQPAGAGSNVQAMTEQHIAAIKAQLAITAAEEPQWNDFAAVMRSNATELSAKLADRTQHVPSMNAVDDLRSYADVTSLRAQEASRMVAPFETLYAALSPAQKQTADAMFRHPGAAMRHGPVRP